MSEEHPSLEPLTSPVKETEAIALEIMEKAGEIQRVRQKIRETEGEIESLRGEITTLTSKIEALTVLKSQNAELEREVLNKLNGLL